MKHRIGFRPHRWRRALAAGSIATVWAGLLFPTIGLAGTVVTYKDKFGSISFTGSDGTAAWAGPWLEIGESNGPSNGAVQVINHSHCATGNCLQIGAEDPDDGGARRTFDSDGATSIILNFDYVRQVSSSGSGSGGAGVVHLLASSDGMSWNLIGTLPMNVDDSSPNPATYDLSSYAGATSAIKFELLGGVDDGHMSIDNVLITVTGGGAPTTTTSLPPTTTSSTAPSTTSSTSATTSTVTTLAPTTTMLPTTTTTAPPKSTTTTASPTTTIAPPRTTTTSIAVAPTIPRTTTTTTPAPVVSSPTTAPSTEPSTTTSLPTTTTTEAGVLTAVPTEPPADMTPEEAAEAKENLVVEIPSVDQGRPDGEGQTGPAYRLDPREGLTVSFMSAVETLKANLLNSVLLGVTISILLLLGIDKREERSSFRASPA
ncbi:MAG: hypothetical protein ACRDVK_08250 [Acidimicrobiia bacterium]